MLTLESESLIDLEGKLAFLETLDCKEGIMILVKGNPSLERFRDKLLKYRKPQEYRFVIEGQKVKGNALAFWTITEVEDALSFLFTHRGFFYWEEKDAFVFTSPITPSPEPPVRRALRLVRYLKRREEDDNNRE
ncbi:MAG: hypothetical protein DRP15_02110 [Candidatus Aenigmatarchaeota archaeon]|nr:MAG: hypothetical protein DRP15_02110 [Candidatus Aenigmarchaeota archaeon]